MKQASDEEVKAELANGPIENIIKSYYADFVEINIRTRADAGIKQMIIREALGGCCEWCQKLVGIYEYGKHPKDIFKRHDNCTCLVTFKDEEGYTDVWSKKKFETQREARIKAIDSMEETTAMIKKFNRERMIAKDKDYAFYDATEEWKYRKGKKVGVVQNANDGEVKEVLNKILGDGFDEKKLKLDYEHDEQEKRVAKLLWEEFGGDIKLLPEVKEPKYIQMADYLWNGVRYDLKTPEKRNKDTVYNAIHKKKDQAKNFIVDISKNGMPEDEAIDQVKRLFKRKGTKFVKRVILVKDEKILKVIEKI